VETTLTDRVLSGRYEIGPLLGRGGMADVYDAVDTRLNRAVAVKVLRPAMASRPDVRRRFEDEARAAAKLSHNNVVAVFDTGEDDGVPWIVMERLSGESLASRLVPGQPLETVWVLQMAGDVLGALSAAHAAGVVHRDIKPGNILIGDDGCAKVTDFGIAKSVETVGDSTTAGLLLGTPRYLSPERVAGKASTASSDIYALGVVLYEALSGRRAYEGDTPMTVAHAVQSTAPPPLSQLRPDLPADLIALVDKAMARDPARRFATAREMAAALAAVQGEPFVDDAGADATVEVAREAWAAGSPDPTSIAAAVPLAAAQERWEGRVGAFSPRTWVPVAVGVLVILLLAALAIGQNSGGGTAGTQEAAGGGSASAQTSPEGQALRAAAQRLSVGDGPRGEEAASRLNAIADKVDRGEDAGGDATALLRDAAQWRASGQLGTGAFQVLTDALSKVPGVDMGAAVVPTAAPKGKGEGKGKDKGDD
jgi:Protein kinase domain